MKLFFKYITYYYYSSIYWNIIQQWFTFFFNFFIYYIYVAKRINWINLDSLVKYIVKSINRHDIRPLTMTDFYTWMIYVPQHSLSGNISRWALNSLQYDCHTVSHNLFVIKIDVRFHARWDPFLFYAFLWLVNIKKRGPHILFIRYNYIKNCNKIK